MDRRRQFRSERFDAKLIAVLAVARPRPAQMQGLAALHPGQRAEDGHLLVRVLAAELGDGVMVLLVEKNDALEDAGERLGQVGRRCSHDGTRIDTGAEKGS